MRNIVSIEEIYDAAFDDETLSELLGRLSKAIDAKSCVVGWHHDYKEQELFSTNNSWSDEDLERYIKNYAMTDIWSTTVLRHGKRDCAIDLSELVSDKEYADSELHNEFFRPMGDDTWRGICVPTWNSVGAGAVGFHRGRSRNGFRPEAVQFLDTLSPHLSRMLTTRARISALDRRIISYEALADTLGHAVFLLDRSLRVYNANAAAEDIFQTGDCLVQRDGKIRCRNASDQRDLQSALDLALSAKGGLPSAFALHRPAGPPLIASVMSARSDRSLAVVIVSDPAKRDVSIPDRLRLLYDLTPGESAVCLMLAEGMSPDRIAEERSVSVGTVRVQVKSIALKLGCSRQAEIVAIVKSLPKLNSWK